MTHGPGVGPHTLVVCRAPFRPNEQLEAATAPQNWWKQRETGKTPALDAKTCAQRFKHDDVPIMLHYLGDILNTVDHL